MVIVFFVIGAVLVFVIAAVFIGGETFRLRTTPTTAVFDMDEAVDVVADGLSTESASGLTYDEVRDLIRFALDHFRAKGLSAMPGEEIEGDVGAGTIVADGDAVAVVLGKADALGMEVTDDAVFEVLELLLAHLADIGALGPQAGS